MYSIISISCISLHGETEGSCRTRNEEYNIAPPNFSVAISHTGCPSHLSPPVHHFEINWFVQQNLVVSNDPIKQQAMNS